MRRGLLTSWRDRPEVLLGWIGTAVAVAGVYAAVLTVGALVASHPSETMLPAIVATVIVAAMIGPVQSFLERQVSRLLPGTRAAPYDAMRQFAARLDGTRDPTVLPQRMARLLAEGTGAAWAQVWMQANEGLRLVATHPADAVIDVAPPSVGAPGARGGLRWVTVGHGGAPLGVLQLQERPGRPLSPVEERLFAGLAAQAGLALHAARLRSELVARHDELSRRAVELRLARDELVRTQDQERRRLERDIHDGAQQQLVALGINLRLAQTLAGRSPQQAAALLAEQSAAASVAHDTVTSLSRGILPRVLEDRGLVQALREVAESSPVAVVVTGGQERRTDPGTEAALYFCGLEAIQNAVKHSGATRITVTVDSRSDGTRLTVSDDGAGMSTGTGTGLVNMRQRVHEAGGTLQVDSAPGSGTTVVVDVPVTEGAVG